MKKAATNSKAPAKTKSPAKATKSKAKAPKSDKTKSVVTAPTGVQAGPQGRNP